MFYYRYQARNFSHLNRVWEDFNLLIHYYMLSTKFKDFDMRFSYLCTFFPLILQLSLTFAAGDGTVVPQLASMSPFTIYHALYLMYTLLPLISQEYTYFIESISYMRFMTYAFFAVVFLWGVGM